MRNFNHKEGCLKCTTFGVHSKISNSVTFPRTNCPERTDALFRQRMYGSHHHESGNSPLIRIPDLDMVEQFPVADELHLLHLGVMKKLLYGWRDGVFRSADTKWPAKTTTEVSQYLLNCKLPAEFHRKCRDLECLSMWKGTELRTFLHYVGMVVLKDHLTTEAYDHFLLLLVAVLICSSKEYFAHLELARSMFYQYIELFGEIYGEEYIFSNVHNLSHVADEVARFGQLESFSAYPFESKLGKIKNLLRNGNRPLAQVAKRMMEEMQCAGSNDGLDSSTHTPQSITVGKKNDGANVPESLRRSIPGIAADDDLAFYGKVQLKDYIISTDPVNCWLLTCRKEIVRVVNIVRRLKTDIYLCCTEVRYKQNFFDVPIESKHFNIYSACRELYMQNSKEKRIIPLSDHKCKMVRLEYHDSDVFIPLLHTNST